jgi:hypothetical protein
VSIHKKGRVCLLERWEAEESGRGIKPNCRNHRHISQAEAFERYGNPGYGKIVGWLEKWVLGKLAFDGYFVTVGGRIEFTITKSECEAPLDLIRAEGLRLEKRYGVPFIERKSMLRAI